MSSDLGRRIGVTLGALLVYRLGLLIPLPGIDISLWEQVFRSQSGGILGAGNMLSGGAIQRTSSWVTPATHTPMESMAAGVICA